MTKADDSHFGSGSPVPCKPGLSKATPKVKLLAHDGEVKAALVQEGVGTIALSYNDEAAKELAPIVEAINNYDRLREENAATHDPIRAEDVDALLAEVNRLRQVEEKARAFLPKLLKLPKKLEEELRELLRLLDAGKGE